MICEKIKYFIIDFYYNYINFNKDRCYECKEVPFESGHCECWYFLKKHK
jgi:hypothetical protein